MTRTAARQIAIQLGFAVAATGQDPEEAVAEFFAPEHYESMAPEDELYAGVPDEKSLDFIRQSVRGVYDYRIELDHIIARYAKGWRTERISRSAAAILRQAIFEILYMPDVPDAASIDEAVEMAKGYEEPDTVAFINGVLGGFYRGEVERTEPQADAQPEPPVEN